METNQREFRTAFELVQAFRDVDSEMPTNYAALFLAVAWKPGLKVKEYADMVGLGPSVTSRILLEIGEKSRLRANGLGLVEGKRDPTDFRATVYQLTAKGRGLASKIDRTLEAHIISASGSA